MKKNVGMIDRVVRVLLALVVVALYFTGVISGTLGIILLLVSVILVITSLISFCPLYFPLGIDTSKKKE